MTDHVTIQQPPADTLAPSDIALRIVAANEKRAGLPLASLIVLGVLGGMYIGFGGALATLALTDGHLGFGLGRLAAGVAFSLGLVLLVIGGGELFTGNNLMVVALASGKASARAVWRNWGVAYAANAAGAILLAVVIHHTGVLETGGVKATAAKIAESKGAAGLRGGFPARRALQHAGVPCRLAERGRPQRGRQSAGDHLSHRRLRRARVRALRRQPLSAAHRHAERGQRHAGRLRRQPHPRHARQHVGGAALAIAYWLVYLGDAAATGRCSSGRIGRSAAPRTGRCSRPRPPSCACSELGASSYG